MKKIILILAWAGVLLATTYNNPGTGGVTDGYLRKNERALSGYQFLGYSTQNANAGANLDSLFITWDNINLYIFLKTNNTASWNVAYGFAIDVIGVSGYTGGSDPSDAWGRKIGFDNGRDANYEIYFWWDGTSGSITSANLCTYTGSGWSYTSLTRGERYEFTGDASTGLQTLEIVIPLSNLGNPTSIAISAFVAGGNGSSAVDAIPCEDDVADNNWIDSDFISEMYELNLSTARTPNYFVILDGILSQEGYMTDEQFYTTGWWNAYVTWDAESIYIGYIFQSLEGTPNYDLHIYFDTDPQKHKNFGKGSSISAAGINLPFKADYGFHIYGPFNAQRLVYSSGSWSVTTFNGQFFAGSETNGTNEISIPWSDIGNPDSFYMVIYLYNNADNLAYGIVPNSANTNGTSTINTYLGFYRSEDGISPNNIINQSNKLLEVYSSDASGTGTLADAINVANNDLDQDTILMRVPADINLTQPLFLLRPIVLRGLDQLSLTGDTTINGIVVRTDSLWENINNIEISGLTLKKFRIAINLKVGSGTSVNNLIIKGVTVDSALCGFYTGDFSGTPSDFGTTYGPAKVNISGSTFKNALYHGIYGRSASSSYGALEINIDSTNVENCGKLNADYYGKGGITVIDNVNFKVSNSNIANNFWGILAWNSTYGTNPVQNDTILNTKVANSDSIGIYIRCCQGTTIQSAYLQGDSIVNNGWIGFLVTGYRGETNGLRDLKIYKNFIGDTRDTRDQDVGLALYDWNSPEGNNAFGFSIGNENLGNVFYRNITGLQIFTSKAKGLSIKYNRFENNASGIEIFKADSILILTDTFKTNTYGVYLYGTSEDSANYNTISRSSFEGNTGKGIYIGDYANEGIPRPVILRTSYIQSTQTLTVEGTNTLPYSKVEVYEGDDGSNSYNGKVYLGETTSDGEGNWTFTTTYSNPDFSSVYITALATSPKGSSSEFADPSIILPINENLTGKFDLEITGGRSITLNFENALENTVKIQVADVSGRIVKSDTYNLKGKGKIDLGTFRNGIYFVNVEFGNNKKIYKVVLVR
jgi:hypothetical protein